MGIERHRPYVDSGRQRLGATSNSHAWVIGNLEHRSKILIRIALG
jgi:hypothetical protein